MKTNSAEQQIVHEMPDYGLEPEDIMLQNMQRGCGRTRSGRAGPQWRLH